MSHHPANHYLVPSKTIYETAEIHISRCLCTKTCMNSIRLGSALMLHSSRQSLFFVPARGKVFLNSLLFKWLAGGCRGQNDQRPEAFSVA